MNRRTVLVSAITALCIVAGVLGAYLFTFGVTTSTEQGRWGEFGDYFGGTLNPLFALAAFLAALWSIGLQQREARDSTARLAEQTDFARKQFEEARIDRVGEELLHVIRDIDFRLQKILSVDVSSPGSVPVVNISHMVAEAERLASMGGTSNSLEQFVALAQQPGSLIEASVREMRYLVLKLREFLEQYSKLKSTSYAPLVVYYADKGYRLLDMLEALDGLPSDTRRFFATISDSHS